MIITVCFLVDNVNRCPGLVYNCCYGPPFMIIQGSTTIRYRTQAPDCISSKKYES